MKIQNHQKKTFITVSSSLIFMIGIFSLGCTKPQTIDVSTGFHFNPKQVTALTLVKSDATSGDHWMAVFKRTAGENQWTISSPPSDQKLADTRANSGFINHLLDTFPTLHLDEPAPKGPLEALGLDPPLFSLRWETPDSQHELRVGSRLKGKGSSYVQKGTSEPYIGSGSALRLLDLIESFPFLREKSWSIWTSDDVDEIEIKQPGKPVFYAQREGSQWTDRKHKEVKKNMDQFLETLTTAQSLGFIDDPRESDELTKYVEAHSQFEAKLMDRHGNVTLLKLKQKGEVLYGINSRRKSIVMSLNSNLLKQVSF